MLPPSVPEHILDWVALIERLGGADRESLARHFKAFSPDDRRLRFGLPVSDAHIDAYVRGLDLEQAHVYGVRAGPDEEWLGIGHLDAGPGMTELGLSVLPAARGHGLGAAIFRYAVGQAARAGISRLYMHFLTSNKAIASIARRAGMSIDSEAGEADAFLVVPPAAELIHQLTHETHADH
jgi:GNAT superfamily N-acetyltransferase